MKNCVAYNIGCRILKDRATDSRPSHFVFLSDNLLTCSYLELSDAISWHRFTASNPEKQKFVSSNKSWRVRKTKKTPAREGGGGGPCYAVIQSELRLNFYTFCALQTKINIGHTIGQKLVKVSVALQRLCHLTIGSRCEKQYLTLQPFDLALCLPFFSLHSVWTDLGEKKQTQLYC